MKTKINILALLTIAAGIMIFAPIRNSPPSDLRDAVRDTEFKTDIRMLSGNTSDIYVPAPTAPGRITPTESTNTAPRFTKEMITAQLTEWLGMFAQLELQPGMDTAAMSAEVVQGLKSGAYSGVIMGESHSVQPEIDASIIIVKDILAGHGIGAFSREANLFPTTEFLEAQKVRVLTFANQFKPDADVQAGFRAARKKLLVTYTGHTHTSIKLKNYFSYTLLFGKPWGYTIGGKDMPTVEESFLRERKTPVIVAMVAEKNVLSRIGELFLNKLIGEGGISGQEYFENLRTLRAVWESKIMTYPVHSENIYFVRSPEQANLFVGITPAPNRKPAIVDAVLQVLPMPECAAWLGGDKIKSVEAIWGSNDTGVSYRVVLKKTDGQTFERTVHP